MDLSSRKCVPCEGGTLPMTRKEAEKWLEKINGWEIVDEGVLKIHKNYHFKNFKESLAFINKVGDVAEYEGHHPDICFGWGKAEIKLFTHSVSGLSENDFILAAKIDAAHSP